MKQTLSLILLFALIGTLSARDIFVCVAPENVITLDEMRPKIHKLCNRTDPTTYFVIDPTQCLTKIYRCQFNGGYVNEWQWSPQKGSERTHFQRIDLTTVAKEDIQKITDSLKTDLLSREIANKTRDMIRPQLARDLKNQLKQELKREILEELK